ncbi:MAG TPA: N-acetylmuramic acid 6-phosphate etherase [Usitatibacter sp.]|nr:N-acetylmuramic acid 6-phosphate etherase [Usitatibacter sp.]
MAKTETPHAAHPELDAYPVEDLVSVFVQDQGEAIEAVLAARAQIASAVDAALPRIEAGGRLIYMGAGTSGRLALLDSVELNPTFSWPPERSVALVAGGRRAIYEAVEGAEDDEAQGERDMRGAAPTAKDVAILLAASGTTPYVLAGLRVARAAGALTVGVVNNPDAPIATQSDFGIVLDTGSELISGSTRLKAGTAQKIALNTFSSTLMIRLNKVYGNLMVDMRPTNAKLMRRAVMLTVLATGTDEAIARSTLERCGFQVKVAILAISRALDVEDARARLEAARGNLRAAMAS